MRKCLAYSRCSFKGSFHFLNLGKAGAPFILVLFGGRFALVRNSCSMA